MNKTIFIAAVFAGLAAVPAAAQTAPAVAPGDAVNGAKIFNQCKACHVVDKGVNRVGPSLFGVVGRKAGTVPNYKYSAATQKSGALWNPATLEKYLEAPMKFMPGTKMAFAGVRKPQDRADIIAFLKTKA